MEKAFLDGSELVWNDSVRHLGNFVDITCNDDFDCYAKKSLFIVYFNKIWQILVVCNPLY